MNKTSDYNTRVLVTYAWVRSAWAVARCLARHGFIVHAADAQEYCMSKYSRYVSGYLRYPDYRVDEVGFVDSIISYMAANDIGTLMTTHEEGLVVARHRKKFPAHIKLSVDAYDTLSTLFDKRKTYMVASQAAVDYPAIYEPPADESLLLEWMQRLPEMGVIKLSLSHGSHGVRIYKNKSDLKKFYFELRSRDITSLPFVQEFIRGEIYAVSGLYFRGKEITALVRKNLREKEIFGGAATRCMTVEASILKERACKLMEQTGYSGVAMTEFLVPPAGFESAKLMEVNPRYWGTTSHDLDCGIPLPVLHFNLLHDLPLGLIKDASNGIVSRWIAGDVIGFCKRLAMGEPIFRTLHKYIKGGDHHYMDLKMDDPIPFIIQSYLYFKHRGSIFNT